MDTAIPTGLSTAEVADRRARGLGNRIPHNTGRSLARILSANVFTVFNAVVGGSFALLLVLGSWQDALFGFFVVANTVIGVTQEFRAKRTLTRLAILNAPRVIVIRNGVETECTIAQVVLGDLLVLRAGEQVAADVEVVASRNLEVDESLLTGEADPVSAEVGRELLSGSTIVTGSGLATVIRVGADSYAARITAEARRFSLVDSELRRVLNLIIRVISIALIPIGAVIINGQIQAVGGWASALSTGAWRDAGIVSVAAIIAMVPAGLVFMTSVAFAVGAARLGRSRVLVRELAAVEGLARVDIVCIDKTGTLTEGSMLLTRVDPVEDAPPSWRTALAWLTHDAGANATARAISFGIDPPELDDRAPEVTVPFASRHKWSGIGFSDGALQGSWLLGGADVVLADSAPDDPVRERCTSLAAGGTRVLVLAYSPEPLIDNGDSEPRWPDELRAVAVIELRERMRADLSDTIRYFAEQGVDVCVISGDEPRTVAAVAREAGLPVSGAGLDARGLPSDPAELAEQLRTERVFGRVTPEQKKAMVLALRSLGHTVAMIGDGVNDALALKHADLGIAMGSGAPATRAVAHVVLLDGEFARLPHVLAEGRKVIANVERLAKLFLSKTVYAITLALVFGLLAWAFPFLPRQLSVVDGLTIGLPALVLGLLPNRRPYQRGFLRRTLRFCLPSGLVVAAAVTATTVALTAGPRIPEAELHAAAMLTLALSALWVLVILARPLTLLTGSIVGAGYMGLVIVLAVPLTRDFLQLAVPSWDAMVIAVGCALAATVALEALHRVGMLAPREHTAPPSQSVTERRET